MVDEVEKIDPITIPLYLLRPIKLNKASGATGFLWPLRKNLPPALIIDWEGSQYTLYLDGEHAMCFFPIKADMSVRGSMRGLLIDKVEFVVDVTSRYDAVQQHDPRGAIILRSGKAYVSGIAFGEPFADLTRVPLWGEYDIGTDDEAIGFTRWTLIAHDGDKIISLWNQDSGAAT